MRKERLRFGCHDFLNSKPLLYQLTRLAESDPIDLIFNTPARLASMLLAGDVDLAVIPSIEYARQAGLKVIPGFSISSFGAVKTVLLFSREKISKIESVAVDSTSRASVAMLRVLLAERYNITPEFISCEPRLKSMMEVAPAALIIGDNAFNKNLSGCFVYDLGEEWYELSSRPFVHALLAVSPGVAAADLALLRETLLSVSQSRDVIGVIAREESKRLRISETTVIEYLTRRIRYTLGEAEIDGLKHFFDLSKKYGLIKTSPELEFII